MEIQKKEFTTSIQHINTIIGDVEDHINNKQDFVAFILIALGIEFLGSFFDDKNFDDFGQSEIRFKNGINLFKKNWYKKNTTWLFRCFRGPIIHQYRAGSEILLTSFCKNGASKIEHLKKIETRRIFVLESLFDDFKLAANKLKEISKKQNSLNPEKLKQEYSAIYNVTNAFRHHESTFEPDSTLSFAVSGTTETFQIIKLDQTSQHNFIKKNKSKRKK